MKRIRFLPALAAALLFTFAAYAKGKPGGGGGGGGGGSGVTNPAFVYSTQAKGNKPTQLYIATADGSKTERLTDENFTEHRNPVWSPDGTKIAFLGRASSTDPAVDGIYVYTLSSGGITQVYATEALGLDNNLDWSPDGTEIASANGYEIIVVDAAGPSNQTPTELLAYSDGYDVRALSWSPDGSEIVFSGRADRNGGLADLFVIDASTGDVANLTNTSSVDELDPDWSAAGIAFLGNGAVSTMDEDGTNVQQLVAAAVERKDVRWSSDDAYISYLESGVLYRVPSSGGSATEVLSWRFWIHGADWNPDWTNDLD